MTGDVLDASLASEDVLQTRSIAKSYERRTILENVSLTLRKGEAMALCGRSGCGKTTLIRIIAGLIPFDKGHLQIGDQALEAEQPYPQSLYGKVGVVFQDHNLFPHLTAVQNVTLALKEVKQLSPKDSEERARFELVRMGVGAVASQYPSTLSGGEKQRVAIARALAMDPLLLLLDEPTANLDPDRVEEVFERIVELGEAGTTMLLVTHNLEFARHAANRYAILQNGIAEVSDDSEILNRLSRKR